jgi:hypothetical protein
MFRAFVDSFTDWMSRNMRIEEFQEHDSGSAYMNVDTNAWDPGF